MNLKIVREDWNACFSVRGMSSSLFRKAYCGWITHPDQMTPHPHPLVDLGWEDSITSFFLTHRSWTRNLKPRQSVPCAAAPALAMHLDQPGGRPSNQNHMRAYFTLIRATQPLKQNVDSEEITGHWWGSNFPLRISNIQSSKRYETSMIPVRVRQDQTYPSFMKECKKLSSSWSEREWTNWTYCSPPINWENITPSTLYFPINVPLIFKERHHQCFIKLWHGGVDEVRTAGKP